MNNQKPEPRSKSEDYNVLDVHSYFFTIQGEGPFAGHRAIFVRLAGCNLQCPGCDTEYTEGRKEASLFEIESVIDTLARQNGIDTCDDLEKLPLIVITGGEPLRQKIGMLVMNLAIDGYRVQIESNGVFEPDEILERYLIRRGTVKLVVSPKTSRVHNACSHLASCFKYVLDHREVAEDGLPIRALQHKAAGGVARPPAGIPVYLNPFDAGNAEDNKKNLDAVARSCMKHGYIAGVQMHKLMNLE